MFTPTPIGETVATTCCPAIVFVTTWAVLTAIVCAELDHQRPTNAAKQQNNVATICDGSGRPLCGPKEQVARSNKLYRQKLSAGHTPMQEWQGR